MNAFRRELVILVRFVLINVVIEPATIITEHRVRSFMYVQPDDATRRNMKKSLTRGVPG